jgi:hypothetical protein
VGPFTLFRLGAGAIGFATIAAHMLSLARMAGNVEGVAGVALETSSAEFAEVSVNDNIKHIFFDVP